MSIDAPARLESSTVTAAVRVMRDRWVLILGVTVVCLLVVLGMSLTSTKKYEATATMLVQKSPLAALVNPSVRNDSDAARDLGTSLLLLKSGTVAERAAKRLNADAGALSEQVDAVSEPDADLLKVTATDPEPSRAAAIANAYADEFVAYRRDAEQRKLEVAQADLVSQINALPSSATAQRENLTETLQQVTSLKAISTGGAEIVDRAGVPSTPSSPNPKRDAVLGIMLGLIAGIGLAFLIDLFDRRIKSVEDFESQYGFRALAMIPQRSRDPSSHRERQAALEPFRILRNGIAFLAPGENVGIVMVTSAMPGEGKSTVAAGLARASALAGQNVVLVEADLRRPTFHEQFRMEGERRGLTTALVADVPVTELMRPALPGLRAMSVLPAGPLPPNAAELLRSPKMSEVLLALAAEVDLVILDAPPLLPVADSRVLLDNPHVDACLLVARAYRTTRDEARRTRAVIESHRLRAVGLVVNGVREADGGYEYYGASEDVVRPQSRADAPA